MSTRSSQHDRLVRNTFALVLAAVTTQLAAQPAAAPDAAQRNPADSYIPVVPTETFQQTMSRMQQARPEIMQRQRNLLEQRYDLSNRAAQGVTMSGGKPVQAGVRVKLPRGSNWEQLGSLAPEQIRQQNLFPAGFLPLPHPNHAEGGMVFPQFHIDAILADERRDLNRFDLEFDLPDHFLPEHPSPIFLTTRPDLGDVTRGQLVTINNFHEMFGGVLNSKQLEGLRLLLTPFPQQQFNTTWDRRSHQPSHGVACFDCHTNGNTNASTHLVGDIRPQAFRRRIDTPTLRGVNIQRLFGSQRALKTVEDFTEFEQRAAYFDGDVVTAAKKGVNVLERGSQVHFMGEFQALLDFPPAPKLDLFGRLIQARASEAERRGEAVFFGKGRCAECHTPPHYTDNTMHDLKVHRFFEPRMINGRRADAEGPIKTFPLRGIKDTPPYLHDGRLLTLEDTVEFFNLVLGVQLDQQEKADLVAFLRVL
jgi:cytochrome c peroxidase